MSRKHYSTEFRDQVVELYQSGRSANSLSREFGPTSQTILHWVHRADHAATRSRIRRNTGGCNGSWRGFGRNETFWQRPRPGSHRMAGRPDP